MVLSIGPRLRPSLLIRSCKFCLSVTLLDIWAVTWPSLAVGKYELSCFFTLAEMWRWYHLVLVTLSAAVGRRREVAQWWVSSRALIGWDWCNLLQELQHPGAISRRAFKIQIDYAELPKPNGSKSTFVILSLWGASQQADTGFADVADVMVIEQNEKDTIIESASRAPVWVCA